MLIEKQEYSRANEALDTAEVIAKVLDDTVSLSSVLNNKGLVQYWLGEFDKSIDFYQSSLELDKILNDSSRIAIRHKNIGISHKQKGHFQIAISHYQRSLPILTSLRLRQEEASLNNSIGNLYNDLKKYDKAYTYLVDAERLWTELKDNKRLPYALGNLGNCLVGLNKIEEGIEKHLEALAIKVPRGNKSSIAITYNNLGEAYLKQGTLNTARQYFDMAVSLRQEIGEVKGVGIVSNNLADLEIRSGNHKVAQQWLNRANNIAKQSGATDIQLKNLRLQRDLFSQTGRYKKAYEIDRLYDEMRQKDFNQQVVLVNELQYEYDIDQEEKAKELAQSKFEASEVDRKAQSFKSQVLTYAIIASLIIVMVVSYLALKLRKQNRHIENLMRELHHRVKNHLGMISGMFGAQTEQGNVSSADLLEEAKTRVEAVNGIHRRLYRQDEYEFVNMQEYLTELVDNSALVFGLYHNIQKELNIDTEPLEIDKAISVGLIANEVLTNGFKRLHLQKTEAPYLKIALKKAVKGYRMVIFNNAKEIEEPITESTGFGSELIRRLTANLHGESKTTQQNGFQFELTFP